MSKLNRISCFLKCKCKEAFISLSDDPPMLQLTYFGCLHNILTMIRKVLMGIPIT